MGTLVPPWYKEKATSRQGLLVAAFFFGASMMIATFDLTQATRQSYKCWRRCHGTNAYIVMLWIVLSSCVTTSIAIWLFLLGKIPPSIWYFVGMLVLWVTQSQCLMQILANRLSLILYNPEKERRIKVGLAIAIGIINVSVFCIWVPARLQISETYIRANAIWDRAEKCIFTVIDAALNAYFMWLVKSKLVANGLTQYNLVYKFNLFMILIIGLMSLPDDAVYVQVHPLTYLAKLNIEMNMAELLGKVVKKSSQAGASIPTAEIYQPHLGINSLDTRDHEWLGSAKDIILPSGGRDQGRGHGQGQGQGQTQELLDTDMLGGLGNAVPNRAEEASGSTDPEEVERRRLRAGSVQEEQSKDGGA